MASDYSRRCFHASKEQETGCYPSTRALRQRRFEAWLEEKPECD